MAKARRTAKRSTPRRDAAGRFVKKKTSTRPRKVGALKRGTARRRRANPQVDSRTFRQVVSLYQGFHGRPPRYVKRMKLPAPAVAMVVGKVAAIEYDTPHNKRDRFRHEFSGRSMPTLAVAPDGRQLLILEGNYHFNDHGIIDGAPS